MDLSHVRLFATPWITACQASLSITISRSSSKLMFIESVMPSSHLILCHPLILLPQPLPASGSFKWGNSSHEMPKVLEFQLQHKTFQWTSRTDLLYDGLVGSPCSPRDLQESSPAPQFKSINSSALSFLHSPILTSIHVYISISPYMTTGKTIALTRWNFVGKVMSLLFNMLSRLIITLLPRSKCLLI